MITKVEIKNFQSHKDSTFDLSEGLNVIVGSGDNGKSAVLKAILWVLTNKPDGDEFISHWAKKKHDCMVTIHTENGYVTRCKGKSNNYYDVNGSMLTAFGKVVPEEVTEFFNLSDLNYQTQFDTHFLLTDSNADVSKKFNEISNLDIIDTTLSNANSYIREMKSKEKHIGEDISNIKEELKSYEGLESLQDDIQLVQSFDKKRQLLENDLTKLDNIVKNLSNVHDKIHSFPDLSDLTDYVTGILRTNAEIDTLINDINRVASLIDSVKSSRMALLSCGKAVKSSEESVSTLDNLLISFKAISDNYSALNAMIAKIENKSEAIATLERNINQQEIEYKELLGDTCPICGGAV